MNIRNLVGRLMFYTFRPFVRMPQMLSIYFHNPKPDAFKQVIEWVHKEGYRFVDISTLLLYMKGDLTDSGKCCVVTFDDAWENNIKLLPIIEKYNVPITIFSPVTPLKEGNYWWEYVQFKGGVVLSDKFKTYDEGKFLKETESLKKNISLKRSAMTEQELIEISRHPLVDIQSHSYTHPILTHSSIESLEKELLKSKQYLSKLLGKDIYAFCYPNGSLSEREIQMTRKYYRCAFSTIQDYPRTGGDVYTIPRYALTDDFGSNKAKMLGVWKWIRK